MDLSYLTNEQLEKARQCETPEEILSLAQTEGIELTDEQLEAVSGGEKDWTGSTVNRCPSCGSTKSTITTIPKAVITASAGIADARGWRVTSPPPERLNALGYSHSIRIAWL